MQYLQDRGVKIVNLVWNIKWIMQNEIIIDTARLEVIEGIDELNK